MFKSPVNPPHPALNFDLESRRPWEQEEEARRRTVNRLSITGSRCGYEVRTRRRRAEPARRRGRRRRRREVEAEPA